jgi:lysophospholipase L1-like esterase
MPKPVRLTPTSIATAALLAWGLLPVDGALGRARETLRNDLPSRADYAKIERGYYEQILDATAGGGRSPSSIVGAAATAALAGHAEPVEIEHGRLTDKTDDVREFVLKPNLVRDPGRRIPWSTNDHGMRDRRHSVPKPPGTVRLALVGDSIAAGWGVGDEQGFEPRLEHSLDVRSRSTGGPSVEVLNFAVPGHGPGQRWTHFAAVGWAFQPDVVLFEATPADTGWDERRLRGTLARGIGFDAPVYRDVLTRAGIKPGLDAEGYRRALRPLRRELLAGVYRAAVADCKARGVAAVWVLIPRVGKPIDPAERRDLVNTARASGFDAVIDICDVYEGTDPRDLAVGPNDFHPNADGHARIARALEAALVARPELIQLWTLPAGEERIHSPPAEDDRQR